MRMYPTRKFTDASRNLEIIESRTNCHLRSWSFWISALGLITFDSFFVLIERHIAVLVHSSKRKRSHSGRISEQQEIVHCVWVSVSVCLWCCECGVCVVLILRFQYEFIIRQWNIHISFRIRIYCTVALSEDPKWVRKQVSVRRWRSPNANKICKTKNQRKKFSRLYTLWCNGSLSF